MATRYVNTASTAGGDGTTNNTSGATRAYATLSEWEAARQANLTGLGAEVAICEGSAADATAVTIDGWTTTASDYIEVKVEQANRHPGTWSTSHYRLVAAASFVPMLNILEPYARLEGLQIQNTGTSNSGTRGLYFNPGVTGTSNDDSYGRALIVRNSPGATGIEGNSGVQTLINCLSYGNGSNGIRCNFGAAGLGTMTCLNCVSAGNGGAGFTTSSASNAGVLRNCYSGGNTGVDYSTNWDTLQTCYSEDGTESTPTAAYSTSSGAYFTNITAGSEDFHIGASSSLKDVGTDLSATFTTDIDGETRPTGASTWDVGVDEIVGGGTSYDVSLSETASASDSLASTAELVGALSEVGTATDSLTGLLEAAGVLSEVGSAADTLSALAVLLGVLSEAGSATDSISQSPGGATYDVSLSEAASAIDTITGLLTAVGTLSESGVAADSLASQGLLTGVLTETGAAADSLASQAVLAGALSEAAAAIDALIGLRVLSVSIVETGNATDSLTAGGQLIGAGQRLIEVRFSDRTVRVDFKGRVISVQLAARTIN